MRGRGLLVLASSVLLAGCASTDVGEPAEDHLQVIVAPATAPSPRPTGSGGVACTQQYGGPQTANVLGRWAGEPVDVVLSRTDGCRITQWDGLGPLLPGTVG
jgi:hypothetical protein